MKSPWRLVCYGLLFAGLYYGVADVRTVKQRVGEEQK